MNFNHIQSNRLDYRPFAEQDYSDLQKILTNPITCTYLPGADVYTDEQVHKWLNYFLKSFSIEKKHVIYAIRLIDHPTMIGYCGCNFVPEFNTNEIKYIFHPDYFGKGYATEAAFTMKDVAKAFGFSTLVGLAEVENIASQRVLEKIGYQYIKTMDIWGGTMKYYELKL